MKQGTTSDCIVLLYSDGNKTITFEQRRVKDISGQDNEKSNVDTVSVNGVTYQILEDQESDANNGLIWKSGDIEFTILGSFTQEDLITMAESVELAGDQLGE